MEWTMAIESQAEIENCVVVAESHLAQQPLKWQELLSAQVIAMLYAHHSNIFPHPWTEPLA